MASICKVMKGSIYIYGCDIHIMYVTTICIYMSCIGIYVAYIRYACDTNIYGHYMHIFICRMHKYVCSSVIDFTCIFMYITNIFLGITYIKYVRLPYMSHMHKFFFECAL